MRTGPNRWGDRRPLAVGLLGGSFNPAHAGHRHIAQLALTLLAVDEVWLLVSPQNPLKPVEGMAPAAARLASATQLLGGDRRLRASLIETALGTNRTIDTLAALKVRFPRTRFVWLMGDDNLAQMSRWHRWDTIFQSVPVAVLARNPYCERALASKAARRFARFRLADTRARGLKDRMPPSWIYLHTRLHPASSSALRAQCIEGEMT